MSRGGSSKDQRQNLPATIVGQIGSESNTRYLRSLPVFHVDPELPEEIRGILDDLERSEAAPGRKR
jgi:hypothetical protein